MPHGKGLNLSINQEQLLDAPVPTSNQRLPDDLEEEKEEAISASVTEEEVSSVREAGDNQNLIEMGVAFPKGATRPKSVARRDREDEDRERQREEQAEEEARRGILI